MGNYIGRFTLKTKLLICEFKERYPNISDELISEILQIDINYIKKFLSNEYLIVPSKMNNNKK
jgi:ribosomal protein S18